MTDTAHAETSAADSGTTAQTPRERAIRSVSQPVQPMPGSDIGSRLVLGQGSGLDALNPFIALMHDDVPPWVMFPTHPHRGVEIITYALEGALHHEDTLGNKDSVVAGGVERNLFGRGFAHSEQPEGGVNYRGLQLFMILSPEDRNIDPSFQLLKPDQVPEVHGDGHRVRVIAGEYGGQTSPIILRTPALYLDVQVDPSKTLTIPVPSNYQGFIYVLTGQGMFGSPASQAGPNQRLVLDAGETLTVSADSASPEALHFVLISARPIHALGT